MEKRNQWNKWYWALIAFLLLQIIVYYFITLKFGKS